MLVAVVLFAAVFAGLTWIGLGARALPIAAGVLLLSCVGVCVAVVITQNRALKEVDQAINRLVEQRRAADASHGR